MATKSVQHYQKRYIQTAIIGITLQTLSVIMQLNIFIIVAIGVVHLIFLLRFVLLARKCQQ